MDRRLSAIVAADMVGYSRLIELDETGTLERQKHHRKQLIDPAFIASCGRIVKEMGDGVLAEFPSVIDAVNCSVRIQRAMRDRETGIVDDRRIQYRIGINLGDIVGEGDDIFGHGVNIAARLEQLAEPGGICISGTAFDQLGAKEAARFRSLGEVQVKNIERPVRAYALAVDAGTAPAVRFGGRSRLRAGLLAAACTLIAVAAVGWWWSDGDVQASLPAPPDYAELANRPGIAVLPFTSLADDPEQDYIADGMTQDLTTDLAKVSGLRVIAQTSAFVHRGNSDDYADIARDLGVRYLVTGNLRRDAGRIRINAQLIDVSTGAHVWADRYDRPVDAVFDLQDDVLARIVAGLEVELRPTDKARITRQRTDNPEAYDAYLRALKFESYFTPEALREARFWLEKALEIDPEYALAIARLSMVKTAEVEQDFVDDPELVLRQAHGLAQAALALDQDLPMAHWAMARVNSRRFDFDGEQAVANLKRAIELDPSYADAYAFLAIVVHFLGRSEEGLGYVETAMRLNPHFPFWYYFALGINQFFLAHFDDARINLEKSVERNPAWRNGHIYLVSIYGHLGMIDEAEWQIEELRAMGFEPTHANWEEMIKIQDPGYRALFFEGLKQAGVIGS